MGISCTYDIDPGAERELVKVEVRKNILLIVNEAMNSIAKHSNASEASVRLSRYD